MGDKEVAVKVEHIRKTFNIPLEASSGLKQKLINTLKGRKGYRVFTPLDDVSFTINKGDFFGIVGRNGSGKSTLLKTIAGIYSPTSGAVHVDGSLIPFIELGVGFNPELTGRENVFLNGALLGFSRKEMEAMYDEIIDFAELHDFMEERLKNYSSGMQIRLAFSIAIKAEGDILLLDEVLAVGDGAFQQKCFTYFEELKKKKKTVILVTHDMSTVLRFCTKAMLINNGKIEFIGSPKSAASKYTTLNTPKDTAQADTTKKTIKNKDISIELVDSDGVTSSRYISGEKIRVHLSWTDDNVQNVGVALIKKTGEYMYATNTFVDDFKVTGTDLSYDFDATIAAGEYSVMVGLFGQNDKEVLLLIDEAAVLSIDPDPVDNMWEGIVRLNSEWRQ